MIHRSKVAPSEQVRQGEEPVIWVSQVHPEPDATLPVLADHVSESVKAYWRVNEVQRFSCFRPYLRETTEKSLPWFEKTVITTSEKLPGPIGRSEVVEIVYEQISPLVNALTEVKRATKGLRIATVGPIE